MEQVKGPDWPEHTIDKTDPIMQEHLKRKGLSGDLPRYCRVALEDLSFKFDEGCGLLLAVYMKREGEAETSLLLADAEDRFGEGHREGHRDRVPYIEYRTWTLEPGRFDEDGVAADLEVSRMPAVGKLNVRATVSLDATTTVLQKRLADALDL